MAILSMRHVVTGVTVSVDNVSMSTVFSESKSTTQVTLLGLVPEDWPLWRGLRLQALAEAPQAFCSTLQAWQGLGDTEDVGATRLTSVPLNLLAKAVGEFVGMVGATDKKQDGTVELISLWVAPSGRGHGIGDLLVSAVIVWAMQQSALRVALDVKADNEHAKALYLRRGFVDVGSSSIENATTGNSERRLLLLLRP